MPKDAFMRHAQMIRTSSARLPRVSKTCTHSLFFSFLVRLLRDGYAESEVPRTKIRLLPRKQPPTLGEKWMKKISLATKRSSSQV